MVPLCGQLRTLCSAHMGPLGPDIAVGWRTTGDDVKKAIGTALVVVLLASFAAGQFDSNGAASDAIADDEDDVIQQVPRNGTDEDGNQLRPALEPGTGLAPEIDIVQVRVERDADNLTMIMTLAGQAVEMLTGEENITQIAYMFFLEDVDEGAKPSSKTGEIGTWAEVVRCSIQTRGNLNCVAAKGNLGIETVDVGSNNVTVSAKIFDPTMFQRLGVGGFTLVFKDNGDDSTFMLDLTRNLDVAHSGAEGEQPDDDPASDTTGQASAAATQNATASGPASRTPAGTRDVDDAPTLSEWAQDKATSYPATPVALIPLAVAAITRRRQ